MLTLFKVTLVVLLEFIYLTLFKARKIKKMSSDKAPFAARKELKKLSEKMVKAAKIDLEVVYLDEVAYKKMKLEDGIVVVANHASNLDLPVIFTGLSIPV